MKKTQIILFGLVVLAETLILAGMIAKREHLLATGKTVLLECVPRDPRSLLSGDYVIINYKISRFSGKELARVNVFGEKYKKHDWVYAALEKKPESKFHQVVAISRDKSKVQGPGRVLLRGRAMNSVRPGKYAYLRLRYGVEQYFVPQYEGKRLERKMREVSVELRAAPSGESAIRRLFIAGEEVKFY